MGDLVSNSNPEHYWVLPCTSLALKTTVREVEGPWCGLAPVVARERGDPEGRLTFGSGGGLGEAISGQKFRAGTRGGRTERSLS